MTTKNQPLGFALRQINTEEFATIDDSVSVNKEIEIQASLRFGVDQEQHVLVCFSRFEFEQEGKPVLIIEVSCQFEIEEASWEKLINEEKEAIILPKGFAAHLAMLTVGTTRGVLHAKTDKTAYNQLIVPTVNVASMINEDVVLAGSTNQE